MMKSLASLILLLSFVSQAQVCEDLAPRPDFRKEWKERYYKNTELIEQTLRIFVPSLSNRPCTVAMFDRYPHVSFDLSDQPAILEIFEKAQLVGKINFTRANADINFPGDNGRTSAIGPAIDGMELLTHDVPFKIQIGNIGIFGTRISGTKVGGETGTVLVELDTWTQLNHSLTETTAGLKSGDRIFHSKIMAWRTVMRTTKYGIFDNTGDFISVRVLERNPREFKETVSKAEECRVIRNTQVCAGKTRVRIDHWDRDYSAHVLAVVPGKGLYVGLELSDQRGVITDVLAVPFSKVKEIYPESMRY